MNWIRKIFRIDELSAEQRKTNDFLKEIAKQTKRNADLQENYNEAYHIK